MFNPLRPWRHPLRLFRTLGYVLTALPVAAITFAITIALLATTAGLLITFVLALPFAWLLFVVSRGLGHVERSRIDALMDVRIPDPVPPLTGQGSAAPALGAGQDTGPVEGDRPPRRPLPRRRRRLRADDGGVGRVARPGVHAGVRRRAARRVGEVLTSSSSPPAAAPRWRRPSGSSASSSSPRGSPSASPASSWRWPGRCSARTRSRSTPPRSPGSRRAARPPSTAPRPSAGASSATSTTAPSSGWSRWLPTSARRARSWTTARSRRDG